MNQVALLLERLSSWFIHEAQTQVSTFALLIPILVCLAASALVALLPLLRSRTGLLVISLLATLGVYRQAVLGYLLSNLIVYLFVAALARIPKSSQPQQRHRWRWAIGGMLVVLIAFLAGRYYELEARYITTSGIRLFYFSLNMWTFLRLITLLWEFGSGLIERPSLPAFVTWMGLPFTLLGPILRYSQFSRQRPAIYARPKSEDIRSSRWWQRLSWAFVLMFLGLLLTGIQSSLAQPGIGLSHWQKLAISFFFAPWSFFLIYAGYFKLMEGLAVFWGVNLPPSFNKPFGRRNLSEFWANWNMTATSVFRDYFFYNRWGFAKFNLYINTLIVFLMVGVWHGLNGYWILWGLLHGIGFCAYLWYRAAKSRFLTWRPGVLASPLGVAARAATYVYVCMCWFLPPAILKLLR